MKPELERGHASSAGHSMKHHVRHAHGGVAGTARNSQHIRLVALDLDGTLLTSRKSITPFTHGRLRAALDAGVKVVLATARPPRSVRDYFTALKLDTPMINYNGALVWDERRKRIIEHNPLDVGVAKKVIAWARKKYPELLVSIEILDKWYTDHYEEIPEYIVESARKFSPDFVGPLSAFLTIPITKLMLIGNPVWIEELEKLLPAKFGKKVAQTRSDPHLLQVMNPHISKARALANVAGAMGISAGEVMAIGDAPNDVHMLQWAGVALAPANAWESVKKVVDAVLPSNDEDCVGHALERYVLGK